jgi:RecA-family ATPase
MKKSEFSKRPTTPPIPPSGSAGEGGSAADVPVVAPATPPPTDLATAGMVRRRDATARTKVQFVEDTVYFQRLTPELVRNIVGHLDLAALKALTTNQ